MDEQGMFVQAARGERHPLLMDAALKAVLLWKYERLLETGKPVSVELQVACAFKLNS